MFSKYNVYKNYWSNKDEHEIRNTTINALFGLIRIFWQIIPVLAILKLCNVVDISWGALILMYFGYELIDYLSDILEIMLGRHDETKARKKYEKKNKSEEEEDE